MNSILGYEQYDHTNLIFKLVGSDKYLIMDDEIADIEKKYQILIFFTIFFMM